MRPDLLALTIDDLAALTNRGTVKRAQRELDEAEATGTVTEAASGDVSATWSDGAACTIPAGVALAQGNCTCAAIGLCRHLVRTVLAYQRNHSTRVLTDSGSPPTPWNPGDIADDDLAKHYRPQALARVKGVFNQGILAEVVRSTKPMARFYQPACVVRFLVPHDPRYAHCDCADPAPCQHVPFAVWAFRQLPADVPAGIVSTSGKAAPVTTDLLTEIDSVLVDFAEVGLSGATKAGADRLARLERRCRKAGLVWPAEVVADLVEQFQRYSAHDSLFAPDRVPDLVGELLARRDAIANDTGQFPQPLIRGTGNDSTSSLGKCRLIGLGCGVIVGHRGVEMVVYLQDGSTGGVAVVSKEYADPGPGQATEPRSFAALGRTVALKSVTFTDLGRGQLLTDGGRRTAGMRLQIGRSHATIQPQSFAWESLKAPTLVEDYTEVSARLAGLPPSALRPHRVAEDFYVLPVTRVDAIGFDVPSQTTVATLHDPHGEKALLSHPFTTRGRAGSEALLAKLHDAEAVLKFVAGLVRQTPQGLVVHPTCCVFETNGTRTAVQPWVDETQTTTLPNTAASSPVLHLIADAGQLLHAALEEVFTLGLRRADAMTAKRWREVQRMSESVGLTRIGEKAGRVADALDQKAHVIRWDAKPTVDTVLELAVLTRDVFAE